MLHSHYNSFVICCSVCIVIFTLAGLLWGELILTTISLFNYIIGVWLLFWIVSTVSLLSSYLYKPNCCDGTMEYNFIGPPLFHFLDLGFFSP